MARIGVGLIGTGFMGRSHAIALHAVLEAVAGGTRFMPDFRKAARIQAAVDAVVRSSRERAWVAP